MNRTFLVPIIIIFLLSTSCENQAPVKILVFSKTAGFRHNSIEKGIEQLTEISKVKGWELVATEDASLFNEDNLKDYSAVIWLNTTGDVLDYWQQADFERYIQSGGGYMGIHAATDTEYDWPWYNQLAGAYFESHPRIQEATLNVINKQHAVSSMLPENWVLTDEWYNFKKISPDIDVLVTIDENSYEGGKNGDGHPISWIQEFDGGRAFYTEIGHRNETWEDQMYLSHLTAGITYAIGGNKRDYSKSRSERVPEENRLVRTILLQNLTEPMELDFIDDNTLLFIERKGVLKEYNLESNQVKVTGEIDVFSELEEGLLGIASDPNYAENKWIYLYHSIKERNEIHLSRYTYESGGIDLSSEKILLKVPVMRDKACCHSGGSIEFGPDGLLYLSTGDNTNPFESDGFAPMDERPGRAAWDAQKSSANANDLRGKILRIQPTDDGQYTIPAGNLFPEGTEGTRPEVYIMGCRNPFRISLDQKNNWLYWGDVGPDAGKTIATRGSKGLDELNQARQSGFYGWPYSRGNNTPYYDYDFTAKKSGPVLDTKNPINDSPNNTGIQNLPEIQPSLIWYSYDKSAEFPWTGTGGKNPMAGPVFNSSEFVDAAKPFPDYFDGKVFFYDWIRDWVFLIGLDENGNYSDAMPFMPNSRFNNPMDMVFGPDGSLYILEYGETWYAQNLDARLNRIDYVPGNRNPVAQITSDKIVGAAPLEVNFSGSNSVDYDGDELSYTWTFAEGNTKSGKDVSFRFNEDGNYRVELTVNDNDGLQDNTFLEIVVGNDPPSIHIELEDENQFYWDNRAMAYTVSVNDTEDGNSPSTSINMEELTIAFSYIPEGEDLASMGHQSNEKPEGLRLIEGSDCKACHATDKKVNGPSYLEIGDRYADSDKNYLVNKIIDGGAGVWGENMMSAHPQLEKDEVMKMVDYILSTSVVAETNLPSLPLSGSISFDQHLGTKGIGKYAFIAKYTDHGAGSASPLTDQEIIYFYPSIREAEEADQIGPGVSTWTAGGSTNLGMVTHGKYFMFKDIETKSLSEVTVRCYYVPDYGYGGTIEVRVDSPEGELLGSQAISFEAPSGTHREEKIALQPVEGKHDLYFVFKNANDSKQFIANIDWVYLGYR